MGAQQACCAGGWSLGALSGCCQGPAAASCQAAGQGNALGVQVRCEGRKEYVKRKPLRPEAASLARPPPHSRWPPQRARWFPAAAARRTAPASLQWRACGRVADLQAASSLVWAAGPAARRSCRRASRPPCTCACKTLLNSGWRVASAWALFLSQLMPWRTCVCRNQLRRFPHFAQLGKVLKHPGKDHLSCGSGANASMHALKASHNGPVLRTFT